MTPKETVTTGGAHPGTALRVMQSAAGFYIGYVDKHGLPYSRETHYMSEAKAKSIIQFFRGSEGDIHHG